MERLSLSLISWDTFKRKFLADDQFYNSNVIFDLVVWNHEALH